MVAAEIPAARAGTCAALQVKPSPSGALTRDGGQETIPIAGPGSDATTYRVLQLATPQAGLHLRITSPAISVSSAVGKRVSQGKVTALLLPVTVLSTDRTTAHIALHVKV